MSVAVDGVRPRHDSEIPEENGAIASESDRGVAPPLRPPRPHPVRQYVARVASLDVEEYPKWDLSKPLPKLPVPELHGTLDKYLRAIKPVVSADQYDKTATLAAEFGKPGGLGCYLQRKLEEYADNTDNWAYQWWLNDMYMNVKLPLPCNSNVGMVFPRQSFPELHNMFKYTARLISGIMDYKLVIDSKTIPVDRCRHLEKGQPMCMTQYYRLFTTYRAPGIDHDSQISYQNKTQPAPQHVLVICKNQFFVLDVVINSTCLSVDNIYTQLKRIYMAAEEGVRGSRDNIPRVGLLTAGQRDHWAIARSKLLEDPTNRETLDMIEKAIFVLCLDEKIPTSFNHQRNQQGEMEGNQEHRDDVSLAKQMLYGLGTGVNSCNRWFDKTMQFIVCEDGACGLNYEHSPSEGIAVVQLIEHLLRYMEEVKQRKLLRMNTMHDIPAPRRLEWHLEPCTHQVIQETALSFEKMISTLDLYVMRFNEYGKNFPKSQNMSPDAYIQLALQLTYYKVHAKLVSTYESASIRRFRFGRVDNIRACTMEALDWCRAMIGETEVTDEKKMELFRRAMKKQTDILQQTILGHGMDNHLLGLRQIAAELGMPKPALFEDESYQMSNHFTLSTSQVPTTMDAFMCYGAVVPDGYGACYNPHPDYILVVITSFNTCGETQSDFFAFTLEGSFMQMKELCVKISQSAKENGVNLSQSTQESNLSAVNNNVIHPIKGQHLENGRQ